MNTVVIVGRPNVGKSTLFNRILQQRKAIVHETEGVTRDRAYAEAEWSGEYFTLIDTGGIVIDPQDSIENAVREQALLAASEADLILFVLDVKTGITKMDDYIAGILRKSNKKVIVLVNKVDDERLEADVSAFYALGFGDPFAISALAGLSIGDLLDEILLQLPRETTARQKTADIRIAILGMPNAGKSTLANTFLGENKHIVTDIAGTTRDSIHSEMKYYGKSIMLVDTAGLRKRTKISNNIEYYSFVRTRKAIRESDVCILIVDVNKGFSNQDVQIIQEVFEQRKGLLVGMNKWDLIEKDTHTAEKLTRKLIFEYPILTNIPIIYVSALQKQRLLKLLDEALSVRERMRRLIPTSELNDFFRALIDQSPPPAVKGKHIKINYITQIREDPPLIAFFCNYPTLVTDQYKKFLESAFRKQYDFRGVPLNFVFKQK